MSVPGRIFQLNARNALIKVPQTFGLYTLFDGQGNAIYSGKAEKETLRERLLHHIKTKDPGLENACFFCIELVQSVKRMDHLLRKVNPVPTEKKIIEEDTSSSVAVASKLLAIEAVLHSAYMN